jgi:hypothetical protein
MQRHKRRFGQETSDATRDGRALCGVHEHFGTSHTVSHQEQRRRSITRDSAQELRNIV